MTKFNVWNPAKKDDILDSRINFEMANDIFSLFGDVNFEERPLINNKGTETVFYNSEFTYIRWLQFKTGAERFETSSNVLEGMHALSEQWRSEKKHNVTEYTFSEWLLHSGI